MEDYIPTALVVFLAKPFFDAFLKKAGEDSYAALKKAVTDLVKRAQSIKFIVVASGDQKVDTSPAFSRIISIYSKSPDGTTMKFLFKVDGDDEYVTMATESLCDMLRYGNLPRPDSRPLGGIYLLYFDRKSKKWLYKQSVKGISF